MNNYYKNKPKLNNSKILYTQICAHKKNERVDFRVEEPLKSLMLRVISEKSESISEMTRLLWIEYLSEIGEIEGYKKKELIYGVDWEL